MARVTIVIPAHNRAHLLERAVLSALGQTFTDLVVEIVDDASKDNTWEVCQRLAREHDRVRVRRREVNGGANAARNDVLREVQSEWIAFLDDDDTWDPRKIELQVARAEAYHAEHGVMPGIVYTDYVWIYPDGRREERSARVEGIGYPSIMRDFFAITGSLMVRRDVFETYGLFDSSFPSCQEWEFTTRCARAGVHFAVVPEVLLNVFMHEGSHDSYNPRGYQLYNERFGDEISKQWGRRYLAHRRALVAFMWRREGYPMRAAREYLRAGLTHPGYLGAWYALATLPFRGLWK